jgi:hypothetical protein
MLRQNVHKILLVQGLYFAITGIWPLLSIESFMFITGPKTDIWLVKTLGAIFFCEGACFLAAAVLREISVPVALLALMNALALIFVDVYYYSKGIIAITYLGDAFAELVFAVAWIIVLLRLLKMK